MPTELRKPCEREPTELCKLTLWPLARRLDVYRVVFAWRGHRKLVVGRLTVRGVLATTDKLALWRS